jgi:hypothetical protein
LIRAAEKRSVAAERTCAASTMTGAGRTLNHRLKTTRPKVTD